MADYLRETPMENPIMGLLADRLKKAQQFAAKPFGYENPPVEMLMNLLGVPAVQQTMERMAYGEPLTTGRGMTTKPRAEAVEAALAVAPVAGLLGKATKGLPVGASIKNVGDDLLSYRGSHKAPSPDFGAPLYDLTGSGQMYPADVYSAKAAQYYGTGYPKADKEAFELAKKVRGNPDAEVTMYRAVPKDEKITNINEGDWVTLSKDYAKNHGESVLGKDYKIISQKVKAKELWTNADSIHEFGYHPQKTAPRQEALDTAQRNAALPVEEGGLGLPKDNTPEMRAEAMGFQDVYHGTTKGAKKEQLRDAEGWSDFWMTSNPKVANTYATGRPDFGRPEGQTVMPLSARFENPMVIDAPYGASWRQIDTALPNDPEVLPYSTDMLAEIAKKQGYDSLIVNDVFDVGGGRIPTSKKGQDALTGTTYAVFDPAQVRSRFAAFDPMRKNDKDLLAGVLPLGLLADEEQRKKLYELMPSLLGE
jgi:hypothetical protein